MPKQNPGSSRAPSSGKVGWNAACSVGDWTCPLAVSCSSQSWRWLTNVSVSARRVEVDRAASCWSDEALRRTWVQMDKSVSRCTLRSLTAAAMITRPTLRGLDGKLWKCWCRADENHRTLVLTGWSDGGRTSFRRRHHRCRQTSSQNAGQPLTACTNHKTGHWQQRRDKSHIDNGQVLTGRLCTEETGLVRGLNDTLPMTADGEDCVRVFTIKWFSCNMLCVGLAKWLMRWSRSTKLLYIGPS